ALSTLQALLADATRSRYSADLLLNYGNEIVGAVSKPGSANRAALQTALDASLERLAGDSGLSVADQLGAVQARVSLALLDVKGSKPLAPSLTPEMVRLVQAAVAQADQRSLDRYERQSVIPSAAHLLSQAGLLDASDALLQAELPQAISPYYHMLVLSSNAKLRGDRKSALQWSEQAYANAVGPATRLQWGSSHVLRLIDLAPSEVARIEAAAAQVIAELDPRADTFFERNRRSLEKMVKRLALWGQQPGHAPVVQKLRAQLDGVCAGLPPADAARPACQAIFAKS
ncbi:MAG: thioredoxin family protein, partial [Rhodoferax sp.]